MSHTKSTNSTPLNIYNRYFEYARVITRVSVTDQGVYQYGQVPTTYGGSQLDLNVVNAVYMVNSKSEMEIFEFEIDAIKDQQDKTGGPIQRDGVQIRGATGDSTVPVVQTTVKNEKLDASRKTIGEVAWTLFQVGLAEYPNQPKS